MQDDTLVVVFPAEFARPRISQLVRNVKKILRIRGQKFKSVETDGDVIVVDGDDPVLASSAISRLFGIRMIAVARRTRPEPDSIISTVTEIGDRLLLHGERFLPRVEGGAKGFVPKDVELAITSAILGKRRDGVAPGSENRYDRLLYAYIAKKSAYACIFLDQGHGGMPNMSQGSKTVCPVFDGVSAVSCIEAVRQGHDVKIVVPYAKESELSAIAKILSRVIQFVLKPRAELEFYSLGAGSKTASRLDLHSSITQLCMAVAKKNRIARISLPITSQMFPPRFVDSITGFAYRSGLLPHMPLEGKEDRIRKMAKEYVLDGLLGQIRVHRGSKFADVSQARFRDGASDAAKTKRTVAVRAGPNSMHDILDSLE